MPKNGSPFFYYDVDGVFLQKYNASAYNTFFIPAHFDGFIFVPVSSLYNGAAGTPDRYDWLWGIFVTVDALSFPNSVVVFGDVFQGACTRTTGDDANAFVFGRDTSKSSHSSFSSLRNTNSYGKVCHYPGFTDDGATEWAEYFLTQTYPCTTAAAGAWSDVGGEFNSLAAADKEILVEAVYAGLTDSQKNSVEKAVERYDLAVKNQSLTNFMSRTPLAGTNKVNLINTNNTTIIIVVACSIMAISAALFLVIRLKRKEN